MDFFKDIKFPTDEEIAQLREIEEKKEKQQRAKTIISFIPESFRDTDSSRLDQVAVVKAKDWADHNTNKLNILIGGKTGAGKTRLAWLIMKRRYINSKITFTHIGAETFARRLINEKHLMEELCRVQLLLFDDIGKERETPTAEAGVFELVRERMDRNKPTIYTTNYDPSGLANRFNKQETGTAVCRRLNESSLCIAMKS